MLKAWNMYMHEKKLNKREYYLSEKHFLAIDFMNEAPEVICDLLFYMSGFIHYRTDQIDQEVYEQMLRCQVSNIEPKSKEQMKNIQKGGWKEDELEIEARMEEYLHF